MPDLLYVVLALGTFALFALAVEGCKRLLRTKEHDR